MKPSGDALPPYRFALDRVFVAAFFMMLLNDHLLRPSGILPPVTGKLSDFAVMTFLPAAGALISVYARRAWTGLWNTMNPSAARPARGIGRADALLGIIASGGVFTAIKTSPRCNDCYISAINSINVLRGIFPRLTSTQDITDLVALPFLVLSYLVMRRYFTAPF
ncbi:MAG: hypothetical protein JXA20_18620 [Spirochaetes bacterium]|nr:hypothetical protein [Spirochaetota bacterium]